jgi:SAM-dependent methyltransferase
LKRIQRQSNVCHVAPRSARGSVCKPSAFDVVRRQFGVMFFPDRHGGYRETKRVLKPGGSFLFSVWDRIEENVFANDATNALTKGSRSWALADVS